MRFSEWLDKLNKQQARLNDLALSPVSENISVDGRLIMVTIGKGQFDCEVDGENYIGPRFLRPLYTNNKEEFDAMLESITAATDLVVEATEVILTSVSEEAIPQAVIARMKGNKTSGEPAELVKTMAEKKLGKLLETIKGAMPYGAFASFDVRLGSIAEKALNFAYENSRVNVQWGRMSIQANTRLAANNQGTQTIHIPEIEEAMYFLANYELIEERLVRFIEQIKLIG